MLKAQKNKNDTVIILLGIIIVIAIISFFIFSISRSDNTEKYQSKLKLTSKLNINTVGNSSNNEEFINTEESDSVGVNNGVTLTRSGFSWQQPANWQVFTDEKYTNNSFYIIVGTSEVVNGYENKGISVQISNDEAIFSYGAGPKLEEENINYNDLEIIKEVYGDDSLHNFHYVVSGSDFPSKLYIRCMAGDQELFEQGERECGELVKTF